MSRALLEAVDLRALLRRRADDRPYVRVIRRPMGPAERAALCVGASSSPLPLRAALLLVEAGELVIERDVGLYTDYVLAGAQAESDGPAPWTAHLPPLGSEITTRRAAGLFRHSRTWVTARVREGRLTARKEDPEVERSPYWIKVDALLLAELDLSMPLRCD